MTSFNENNQYKYIQPLYKKLFDLHEADPRVLRSAQYLFPHELELSEDDRSRKLRQVREQRSIYTDYLNPFIKRFTSLIFKNPMNFERANEVIFNDEQGEREFQDIDGYGNSLEFFIKNVVAESYFLYGKAAIYVDSFQTEAQSRQQEIEVGARPFMELWEPLSLIDWKYSSVDSPFNGLDFAVRRYKEILPRETAKSDEEIVEAFRHVYIDPVTSSYIIESLLNGVSEYIEVPEIDFVPLAVVETKSWLKQAAEKAIQIYNLESTQDNILLFQAHQRLFAVGNFAGADGKFAAAEGNLVVLRGEGSITAVEPVNTASIESRINQIKSTMFQLVFHQTRQISGDSAAVESADTMREAKAEAQNIAQAAAQDIQQVVNQALWFYARFRGIETEPEDFVVIDSSVGDEDVEDFALWMNSFGDRIRRYPTWQKSLDKKVAQMMNLAENDEIIKEIEAGVVENDPVASLFSQVTDDQQQADQGADNAETPGQGS